MPKMKTRSSVKKRFTVTASGKLKRRHAYHSHILTKKSNKEREIFVHTVQFLLLMQRL